MMDTGSKYYARCSFVVSSVLELEPQEPELFALSEPEPEFIRFWSGFDTKENDKSSKSQKIKNEVTTFLATMLHITIKKQDFVHILLLEKLC